MREKHLYFGNCRKNLLRGFNEKEVFYSVCGARVYI